MTALADIALAFCREAMGWGDCWDAGDQLPIFASRGMLSRQFAYTDLSAVLPAAQSWATAHGLTLRIIHCPDWDHWYAELRGPQASARVTSPDLCRAIMEACLAAGRGMG